MVLQEFRNGVQIKSYPACSVKRIVHRENHDTIVLSCKPYPNQRVESVWDIIVEHTGADNPTALLGKTYKHPRVSSIEYRLVEC